MKVKSQEWVPMTLEGVFDNTNLEGLIGIEELKTYDENIFLKGKKAKRKLEKSHEETSPKKDKLQNQKGIPKTKNGLEKQNFEPGFFVRNPNLNSKEKFSEKTENQTDIVAKKKRKRKKSGSTTINGFMVQNSENGFQNNVQNSNETKNNSKNSKKSKAPLKTKLENPEENFEISNSQNLEDLRAWDIVTLPTSILRALSELKFTKPTLIQEKTLPSAILGRRDILGAAETGSGKTLAFGLPILVRILNMKEKEETVEENGELEKSEDENELTHFINPGYMPSICEFYWGFLIFVLSLFIIERYEKYIRNRNKQQREKGGKEELEEEEDDDDELESKEIIDASVLPVIEDLKEE